MKKPTNTILTSFVLASSLLITACDSGNKTANVAELAQYTKQGATYLEQSQFKAAINSANNAIVAYPGEIEGYLILAKVYNKLGQSDQAINVLNTYKGERTSSYDLLLLESYLRSQKIISAKKLIDQQSDNLSKDKNQFALLQAKLALLENKPDQALTLFKGLQQSPGFESEGFIGEARIAAGEDKKDEALLLLDKATQADAKNVEALVLKGFLFLEKGEMEKAETTLSSALTVIPSSDIFTPERINILKALTSILTSEGRSSEALLYSRILSDEFPTATNINEHYTSAQEYYKRKQIELAKKELYEILKIDALNKKASTMLGVILYTEGDLNGAEKYLSGMIDPEVNTPQLTQIYAMTQLKLNQGNDVLSILDGVIEYEERLDTLSLYVIAAISEKQFDKADVGLKRLKTLFPKSPKLALLESSYVSTKTPEKQQESLDILAKSLVDNSSDLALQTTYLKKLIEMKELDKADQYIQKEAAKNDNAVGTNLLIANYYLYRKDFSVAEQRFNDIIKTSSDEVDGYYGLAQSKQLQKNWGDAFKEYQRIINLYPEQIRAYYGAVVALRQQGKDPLSIATGLSSKQNPNILALVLADYQYQSQLFEQADKLIKTVKSLPVEFQDKAVQLQQKISNERIVAAIHDAKYPLARELVLAQLQLTPDQPLFLMRLVNIETLAGQYVEAEKVITQIESVLPNNYQTALLRFNLALAQNDKTKAESLLKTEWDNSHQEEVGVELYKFYQKEDERKASEFLSQWLTGAPSSVYANLNSGMALQAKGDNKAAIEAYEKVLAIAPNELTSLNNAAWLYSLSSDSKAEGLAARAYKLAPNNAAVIDTYGWILYQAGKVEEAKVYIKKALELLPDDAEVQKHWETVSK